MIRLTQKEERRVSALCRLAWDELLKKKNTMLSVSLEDIHLLMKAGAMRIMYGRASGKWRVEVELYQHIFVHENDRYFFISKHKRRSLFP